MTTISSPHHRIQSTPSLTAATGANKIKEDKQYNHNSLIFVSIQLLIFYQTVVQLKDNSAFNQDFIFHILISISSYMNTFSNENPLGP